MAAKKTTENLKLWDSLAKTPPEYTKDFNKGGFKGTSIKPHYMVRKATEAFGPIGTGWGFKELEHEIIDGPEGQQLWLSHVEVWYQQGHLPPGSVVKVESNEIVMPPGPVCKIEQWGATYLVQKTKSGLRFDDEAAKKSVTDGMTKCLSLLGIAADIHLGEHDQQDDKYQTGGNGFDSSSAPSGGGFDDPPPSEPDKQANPQQDNDSWGEPGGSEGTTSGVGASGAPAAVGAPKMFGPVAEELRVPEEHRERVMRSVRGRITDRCKVLAEETSTPQDPQFVYDALKTVMGIEHLMEADGRLLKKGAYVFRFIEAWEGVPF